jgi:MFS transporter, PPP family, 3-phenylpropionic acid transporter
MLIVILVPEKARINRSTSVSKPLSTGMAFKTILKNRQYIAILICYLFIEMSNTPMQNYLTRKFEVLGAGDIYTGLSFLVMGIMQLPALLCFDKISKRFRPILLMIVSFGGIALRLVILGFAQTPVIAALSFLVEPVASGLYIGAVIQYMKDILPANVQYLGLSFYSAFTTGVAGLAGNYITGMLSDSMGVLAMMKLTTIPSIMGFLFFAVTSIVFMHRREA